MAAPNQNHNQNNDDELVIERLLDAPRQLVYQAFTEPQRMLRWFGPRGYSALDVELDVRPGGKWRGGMRAPDGTVMHASGVYREVVPGERLVFTYAWEAGPDSGHETTCRLELADEDGRTRMTFSQRPFPAKADRDGHAEGWSEAFDKLSASLAP